MRRGLRIDGESEAGGGGGVGEMRDVRGLAARRKNREREGRWGEREK